MQQNEVNPNAYSDWDLTLGGLGRAEIMVDATKKRGGKRTKTTWKEKNPPWKMLERLEGLGFPHVLFWFLMKAVLVSV